MGRNWDYSKAQGRTKRLSAELHFYETGQPVPSHPPLFSHCGTMQAYFAAGWNNVTAGDIRLHIYVNQTAVPAGTDNLSKFRSLKQCLFQ